MTDRVGQHFGNYRLTRLLGRGGFAEVYLAEHTQLGMKAAIKILHASLSSSDEISAFRQEARTIAELSHPHIIRVLDFDVQNGMPFLVLDYAPEGSLRAIHPRGCKLSLDLVVTYVQQIASALQYAHEHKVIHRDVKPENMLLGSHGELLLTDFGIATIAHSTSSLATAATMGTLAYMAPEQIQGKPRPASDQYALAVTVYQWLTGTLPFVGSAAEIIAQHLGAPPPPLRTSVPDLPVEVEQVVLTALAKDHEQRFGSMQAFANAFALAGGRAPASSPLLLASSAQPIEPVVEALAQQVSPATVAPRSELSETPPAQPALTPPQASLLSPPSAPRRWNNAAVISGLALVLVIGSVLWFNRTGQGDGTSSSPYRLSAWDSSVQHIGITLQQQDGPPGPTVTVTSLQIIGNQTELNLSLQGLDASQQYQWYTTFSNLSSTGGGCQPPPSSSLYVLTYACAPQAGQKWMLGMMLAHGYLTENDVDYQYLYLQF